MMTTATTTPPINPNETTAAPVKKTPRTVAKSPIHIEVAAGDAGDGGSEPLGGWMQATGELGGAFDSTSKAERALKSHGKEGQTYRIVAIKRASLKLQAKPVVAAMTFA